jgi:hypothetical protein
MRKIVLFVMSAAVLASSSAFAQAQGLTRAEVRQQLIEAQQDGSQLGHAGKTGYIGLWRRSSRFERQLVALCECRQPES